MADRLEERGLLQRSADPRARRAKALSLTPAGVAFRERFGRALAESQALDDLTLKDLRQLAALLAKTSGE